MASAHSSNDDEVKKTLRHASAELGRDFSRTARDAQEAAQDIATAIGRATAEGAQDASHSLRKSIRENPIAWLSAAAGVGVLIAMLFTQRHRAS
ncbi:MAG: hypothetical protein KJS97_00120 [Alphaproteobacteria bacterium]|nr:hypothetical protein [Alphaproteobacteria bacterium]